MWFPAIMLILAIAIAAVVVLHYKQKSPVVTREEHMVVMNAEPASSYEQKTNHMVPQPADMGPLVGAETPHRVNAYFAHM